MLDINDINYIKLLYEQFLKMNYHLKKLFENGDWDAVETAIKEKEVLQKKILTVEKPHITDIKNNPELLKFRKMLIQLEADNIELVKSLKQSILKEISNVKLAKKILNTYEPVSNKVISTFEVKEG